MRRDRARPRPFVPPPAFLNLEAFTLLVLMAQVQTSKAKTTGRTQKVTTYLMFNDQTEAAVKHYTSVFKDARIVNLQKSDGKGPVPKGKVLGATFEIHGQQFMATDGGPTFTFSQGISLLIRCENQREVDELWEKLSAGGGKGPCGWVTDKFGVSWQIVPTAFMDMMEHPEAGNAQKAFQAMLTMSKLDIKTLQKAYES